MSINLRDLYPDRIKPSHEMNILLARKMAKGDRRARQKLIEANVGIAYNNALRYAKMNEMRSQIDEEDLLQAAFVGLCEAVDNWDADNGTKFSTYAQWWINKRISDEVSRQHWTAIRPPEKIRRLYMYRHMDEIAQDNYVGTFMTSWPDEHDHQNEASSNVTYDEQEILTRSIIESCEMAELTLLEDIVFFMMHDPRTPPNTVQDTARELGIRRDDVERASSGAIGKIRKVMGIH